MTRQILSFCLGTSLLMVAATSGARAADLPIRKAGLWEMKVLRTGSPMPEMTMQHCTDETTDKQMSTAFSPLSKEICSRNDVLQTATGYVTDSVCSVGGASMTSHSDITGDFNSAYTVKTATHSDRGPAGLHDVTMAIEAKYLGACKPDQKPGDIVMPGGFKLNIKDAEKLKGLLPK
ncbi:MAG: DUF3617 family protein [Bradyrhizobium sp.]